MAAYSHSRVGSRGSLDVADRELPNGSCNYRDLSIGSRAPVCGCTRFWLNASHFSAQDGGADRAWCFCGHHACFHGSIGLQLPVQEQGVVGSRATVHQELGTAIRAHTGSGGMAQLAPSTPQKRPTGLGIQAESRVQSQSINTRVWQALNDFARNQEDGVGSDSASVLPSTNAPSLVEEPRLSPNRIIQERLLQYQSMAPPLNIPTGPIPRPPEEYSATEVATPSIAGTPDFRAMASSSMQTGVSPGHLQPSRIEPRQRQIDEITPPVAPPRPATAPQPQPSAVVAQAMSQQELQSILRVYGQRIEVLESLSFSQVPVEELQDRFELFDGRILDLEHWRTEQESHQAAEPSGASTSKRRKLLPTEASFGSDASFDSSAAAHTEAAVLATLAANAETLPRIDALERRVGSLENTASPSLARPWQVKVILLPWGQDLRGIWFSPAEATQHSMRSTTQQSEEWTGAQSAPKLSFKSSDSGAWTTESIQAWAKDAQEWLSPKACGPSGAVFQRLASRGLVRDVTLTASDARHVLDRIRGAFDGVWQPENEAQEEVGRYQGLREPFIPLRKVRKSTRLRFLSSAEMVTSASWTASFLDSSVFMKFPDGPRRLYMTTPAAYNQASGDAWSWERIRDLPRTNVTGDGQAAQNENLAIEAFWGHNEKLDYIPSVHSSFGTHESQWSTRSQLAANDLDDREQPPASPRSESLLPRQRTASLPSSSSAVGRLREILPKRRVASFEPVATVPIHADESGIDIVAKRRRISLSPEAERRGVNFTPRLSREPPSPFTSEAAAEGRSQGTGSRKRGTTPFAYATPHSNSHFVSRLELLIGDGDTEADTDLYGGTSERGEEEWEGVGDDGTNRSEHGSVGHDKDIDAEDDELDVEGMELYAP